MYFLKKIRAIIVMLFMLLTLQNCATIIGGITGDYFDDQHRLAMQEKMNTAIASDSTAVDSESAKKPAVPEAEQAQTNYFGLGLGIGATIDLILIIKYFHTHPLKLGLNLQQ